MAFKPMFALHKDESGNVLAANDFTHEYQLSNWLNKLRYRAGDVIEFREVTVRPEFEEVDPFTPTFIETPPTAPPTEKPILADDPF